MKKHILIFCATVAVILLAVWFSGAVQFNCSGKHDPHAGHAHGPKADPHAGHDHGPKADPHAGHDHEHASEAGGGTHLTPEQIKLAGVKVSKAAMGKVRQVLELHGEVKLNADRTAKIMQRVPGFVTQVCVSQGDFVKKGTLMAKLTSHKLGEHFSDYYSSKALEEVAASEFKMAQKLYSSKAMAEKEYLRYKRDYVDAGIARRKAEIMLRSLDLDLTHMNHKHGKSGNVICTEYDIIAPFDGSVVAKDISLGEKYADDNTQVLFVVSDLGRLWVELRADSSELKQVKPGMSAEVFPLDGQGKCTGKVTYVSRTIDEASRKGFVRVEIENAPAHLHSGEFAKGRIALDTAVPAVVVPRSAVQLVAGETVVFVPAKGDFITRVVRTGVSNGSEIEIVSGLSAGEEFVSAGAFELKAVMLTSGMDPHAGHGH